MVTSKQSTLISHKGPSSWDPVWERTFQSRSWGKYPPEELVRFVARNFYSAEDRRQVSILEIGCGPGANLWFMAREGFDVYGIDGSSTALRQAGNRLANDGLSAQLLNADIVKLSDLYPASSFDAIIDIACLQHNKIDAVEGVLRQLPELLKPAGRIFSMMIGSGSWGDSLGEEVEPGTLSNVLDGPLKGTGVIHFFTLEEIERLFSREFEGINIEISSRSFGGRSHQINQWIIEGVTTR